MQTGFLEHVNVTVTDSAKTAKMLCDLFGWKVRWSGPSLDGGTTYHVGTNDAYLAVYMPPKPEKKAQSNHVVTGGLNHIGVLVQDIGLTENRVLEAGFKPNSHSDYEPGKRFYFYDDDGIEYEVVSYS